MSDSILKASGDQDVHIDREIGAHREWLQPLVHTGHAPEIVYGDTEAKLLVTRYLPGQLVLDTAAQNDPDTYRQAGALLARLHGQSRGVDPQWDDQFRARVRRHLAPPHRIEVSVERRIRAEVEEWPVGGATVVPTHGDWQPRNWLADDGAIRMIDFGRAALRPAHEDLVRLARQDFAREPALETAFFDGYGDDPRQADSWRRSLIGEAVGTAVWAYRVRDAQFEKLGHQLLRRLYP